MTTETQHIRNYRAIKAKYPKTLLLYRQGDFYVAYEEDATTIAQVLDLVLTQARYQEPKKPPLALPHAGFPAHALENYLPKLVKAQYRVAIADALQVAPQLPELTQPVQLSLF